MPHSEDIKLYLELAKAAKEKPRLRNLAFQLLQVPMRELECKEFDFSPIKQGLCGDDEVVRKNMQLVLCRVLAPGVLDIDDHSTALNTATERYIEPKCMAEFDDMGFYALTHIYTWHLPNVENILFHTSEWNDLTAVSINRLAVILAGLPKLIKITLNKDMFNWLKTDDQFFAFLELIQGLSHVNQITIQGSATKLATEIREYLLYQAIGRLKLSQIFLDGTTPSDRVPSVSGIMRLMQLRIATLERIYIRPIIDLDILDNDTVLLLAQTLQSCKPLQQLWLTFANVMESDRATNTFLACLESFRAISDCCIALYGSLLTLNQENVTRFVRIARVSGLSLSDSINLIIDLEDEAQNELASDIAGCSLPKIKPVGKHGRLVVQELVNAFAKAHENLLVGQSFARFNQAYFGDGKALPEAARICRALSHCVQPWRENNSQGFRFCDFAMEQQRLIDDVLRECVDKDKQTFLGEMALLTLNHRRIIIEYLVLKELCHRLSLVNTSVVSMYVFFSHADANVTEQFATLDSKNLLDEGQLRVLTQLWDRVKKYLQHDKMSDLRNIMAAAEDLARVEGRLVLAEQSSEAAASPSYGGL